MQRDIVFLIDRDGNHQSHMTAQEFASFIGRFKGVSSSIPLDIWRNDVYVIRVSHVEIDADGYRLENLFDYVQRFSGDVSVLASLVVYDSFP